MVIKKKYKIIFAFLSGSFLSFPVAVLAQYPKKSSVAGSFDVSVAVLLEKTLYSVLGAAGILAFLGFPIAAILYVTAGGDESRIGLAGKTFSYSLLGFIASVGGTFSLDYVKRLLGI
jgi:hypothetical protein